MDPRRMMLRRLSRAMVVALGMLVLGVSAPAFGQGKPAPKPRKKPPGPPKKMKLEEVFISQNYCLVDLRFFDSQGKKTSPKTGTFYYWSNFLKGKRKPQSKRKFDVSKVANHKHKWTLKLPGVGKVCPPRMARLKITFTSKSPRIRIVRNWKKKATCK